MRIKTHFMFIMLGLSLSTFGQDIDKSKVEAIAGNPRIPSMEFQYKFKDLPENSILKINIIEISDSRELKETHNKLNTVIQLGGKKSFFSLGVNHLKGEIAINRLFPDRNVMRSRISPKSQETLDFRLIDNPLNIYNKEIPLIVIHKSGTDYKIEDTTDISKVISDLSKIWSDFYIISYTLENETTFK